MANQRRVDVVEGDITHVRADAIVNAANTKLSRGGGVGMRVKLVAFDHETADCLRRHL